MYGKITGNWIFFRKAKGKVGAYIKVLVSFPKFRSSILCRHESLNVKENTQKFQTSLVPSAGWL